MSDTKDRELREAMEYGRAQGALDVYERARLAIARVREQYLAVNKITSADYFAGINDAMNAVIGLSVPTLPPTLRAERGDNARRLSDERWWCEGVASFKRTAIQVLRDRGHEDAARLVDAIMVHQSAAQDGGPIYDVSGCVPLGGMMHETKVRDEAAPTLRAEREEKPESKGRRGFSINFTPTDEFRKYIERFVPTDTPPALRQVLLVLGPLPPAEMMRQLRELAKEPS